MKHLMKYLALILLLVVTPHNCFADRFNAENKAPSEPVLDLTQMKLLYSSGQYVQVADALTPYLKQNPDDFRARVVQVLALLKLNEKTLARTDLNILESSKDSHAIEYARQLEAVMISNDQEQRKKQELYTALANYDPQRAATLVNDLQVSAIHKGILLAYIAVYRGDFKTAHARLQALTPTTIADTRAVAQIDKQITDEQSESDRLHSAINAYLFSEITSSVCSSLMMTERSRYPKGGPFVTVSDFHDYVENVTRLNTLTPLDAQVMDLVFHVTLLGGEYDNTAIVGDKVLSAKGSVRIPFLSSHSYFWLVIDARKRRLSTEPYPTKLIVALDYPAMNNYTGGWTVWHIGHHSSEARWYQREEPFDLSFDEITAIDQHAKDFSGGLQSKAYALRLSPKGLAPNYLGMNVLACLFGEEAQRRATRSLGMYIQHVAAPHTIQASLVDPVKHSGNMWSGQMASAMAAVGGVAASKYGTASNVALASMVSQQIATQQASKLQNDMNQQDLSTKWFAEMHAISESFQENESMIEVEKLLQLQ